MKARTDPASPLPDEFEAWLNWLATQRRASPLTLKAYRAGLESLLRLADGRPVAELETQDIRRFVARLHGEGLQGRSIARHLSAWRGLYRWLIRQRGLRANPALGVRPPRTPSTLPRVLSPDQAKALLDPEAENLLETRDIAMFELFYSSGLRVSELAGLDVNGGLDLAEAVVTVRGKRNRSRSVPVGSKAMQALRAWLAVRAGIARAGEPALFVTRSGGRLSTGGIASRLGHRARTLGLGCTSIRTCCGTVSPAICCSPAATCARCRNCSVTPASAARRSIRISTFSTSPRCMTRPIRAQKNES